LAVKRLDEEGKRVNARVGENCGEIVTSRGRRSGVKAGGGRSTSTGACKVKIAVKREHPAPRKAEVLI